jgi:hypothetical protein
MKTTFIQSTKALKRLSIPLKYDILFLETTTIINNQQKKPKTLLGFKKNELALGKK